MATLKDGRFMFIHADRRNLLLERQVRAVAASPSSTATSTTAAEKSGASAAPSPTSSLAYQLVYGGVVHAFALNAAQSRIAMVCPRGSEAATSAAARHLRDGGPNTVLRLFSFSRGEVGELIDELVTAEACDVVWVGHRHLALEVHRSCEGAGGEAAASSPSTYPSSAPTTATVLIEVSKTPERLKRVRHDHAAASPVSAPGSVLCDVHVGKQSLRFWDLQKGKVTRECALPNRRCRHGKTRTAAATCSDGPFVFVVNDDWTVHGFHVKRRTVRELKPMLSQFESQSVNIANNRGGNAKVGAANSEGQEAAEVGEGEEPPTPPQPAKTSVLARELARPRLFARAVSDTQVLLALQGSSTILQCACGSKGSHDVEWSVVAKMRLPRRLQASCEVVGLSTRGCLVRQYEVAEGGSKKCTAAAPSGAWTGASGNSHKTAAYVVVPLDMKATGKAPVEMAAAPPTVAALYGSAGASESSAAAAKADAATGSNREAAATPELASETSRMEGKRKRKKTSAPSAAAAASPVATCTRAHGTDSGEARRGDCGSAGGPLQRAVRRLLVHAGIGDKDQLLGAFAKDAATDEADPAAVAATAPQVRRGEWYSTDVLMTAGGLVVGAALGALVMRRLSLL
ncbi:hypothetical protein LSCM4_02510 [Leishmania orientalis]|uniref:Uncharacterized protein n=1 Tax=Leishmania orientalis TaxID=2249476 RepID=A0A836GSG4_9TRYP|nr:hypothetical protein LSCM4_02510 [Leishmania orientalis]